MRQKVIPIIPDRGNIVLGDAGQNLAGYSRNSFPMIWWPLAVAIFVHNWQVGGHAAWRRKPGGRNMGGI